MKYIKWFLISAVVLCTSVSAFAGIKSTESATLKADYINAFTLNDYGGDEYPQNTNMTSIGLNSELLNIIDYATKYDFNTIFFNARTKDGAFYGSDYFCGSMPMLNSSADPLLLLCNKANAQNIDVYASVNIFETLVDNPPLMGKLENQTISINGNSFINFEDEDNENRINYALAELVKEYPLKGILLTGFDSAINSNYNSETENIEFIVKELSQTINSYDTGISIGISLDSSFASNNKISKALNNLCKDGDINFIVPVISDTTESSSMDAILNLWNYFSQAYGVEIYPQHQANRMLSPSTNTPFFQNPHEILYQLYLNHSVPMDGSIISSYSDLKLNLLDISENIYHVSKEGSLAGYENLLKIPNQELELNISSETLVTDEDSYYLTGTSDPYTSLTVNNTSIRRVTKNGMFDIKLKLDEGSNIFTFAQNSKSKTINIFKTSSNSKKTRKMDASTSFPRYNEIVFGESVTLEVVAPSGATITAMIGKTVYPLEPNVLKEETGEPVKYTATVQIPSTSYAKDLGNVVYSMNYKNLVTTTKSPGRLYSPANKVPMVAQVNRFLGNIYEAPSLDSDMLYTLKEGTRDIVVDSNNDFYELKSGGFIQKELVSIPMLSQPLNAQYTNYIGNVVTSAKENSETFTLIGCKYAPSKMAYDKKAKTINMQIYNIENFPVSLSHLSSTFFEKIDVDIHDTTVYLRFKLNEDIELWGTNISFKDGNMHILFRTPPEISTDSLQPLKHLTIFIDPSFGGDSKGTLSPIGEKASDEADLNLINAYALMIKLRSLGASVIMSRNNDDSYATDDRLKLAESFTPDLYINLRHYSNENKKENFFGVDYTTDFSLNLATQISNYVSSNLRNRNTKALYTKQQLETQITYCPSVSIDLGNIMNLVEYENLTNNFEIYKTASAISSAIVETIKTS